MEYKDGDTITIEGKRYVIAGAGFGFALLNADGPGWMPADLEPDDECPHDELDHGICLVCGADRMDDMVAAAEFRADCLEDR